MVEHPPPKPGQNKLVYLELPPADKILLARNKKTFFYSFFFHGTMFIFFF